MRKLVKRMVAFVCAMMMVMNVSTETKAATTNDGLPDYYGDKQTWYYTWVDAGPYHGYHWVIPKFGILVSSQPYGMLDERYPEIEDPEQYDDNLSVWEWEVTGDILTDGYSTEVIEAMLNDGFLLDYMWMFKADGHIPQDFEPYPAWSPMREAWQKYEPDYQK